MLIGKINKTTQTLLKHASIRQFSIVAPEGKLHQINHPRYGRVYPIASINDKEINFGAAKLSIFASSIMNTTVLYSLFVKPIFIPAISAVICNPLFILPSFALNYYLLQKYYIFFFNRSFITNMFLKPNGKQVIVETLDGESKVINNKDFFNCQPVTNRYQHRIDMYHGANNYLFLRGNSYFYNSHLLTSVLTNNFVDVNNVAYDYDINKEFAWDYKELVEIKKRKRRVNRFYKPNFALLSKLENSKKFEKSKSLGILQSSRHVLKNFKLFSFQKDQYSSKEEQAKQVERNELYVNYAGNKQLKVIEQHQSGKGKETAGRKVHRLRQSKSVSAAKN